MHVIEGWTIEIAEGMYSLCALLLQTHVTQYKLPIYLAFAGTIHILRKITGMLTKVIPDPPAQNLKELLFIDNEL